MVFFDHRLHSMENVNCELNEEFMLTRKQFMFQWVR